MRSRKLDIFANLKTELEDARDTADHYTQIVIDGCLSELPEAEEWFSPVDDRQAAERVRQYAEGVRKVCRLDTEIETIDTKTSTSDTKAVKPKANIPPLETLLTDFCNSKAATGDWKPHRVTHNTSYHKRAFRLLKDLTGVTCVTQLDKQNARQFKEGLLSSDYKRSTADSIYRKVSAVIDWVIANTDHIEINPLEQIGGIKGATNTSAPPMTRELMVKLLDTCSSTFRDVYRLYYFTGVRSNELLEKTTWETVDGIKCLQVGDTKTEAGRRHIPLHHSISHLYGYDIEPFTVEYNKTNKFNADIKAALGSVVIKGEDKAYCLNSFRQGYADKLRAVEGSPDSLIKALMGHAQDDVTHAVYGEGWNKQVKRMKAVIDQIPEL
ncbi:hypothetical protein NX722_26725 [Endozoicomonas gorgoniicola]|uniref:Tyr recombinase domain-containing protein n=1 Tax=Endozoicomonas gorgoniicola TaxID=1234144 RepID=A0ABT3N3E5_9GAMM|nr:hypothetical protein [Endozoicomonas gorgoniicola]MCW7556158.1 hypothetical protein [Endozoicomonas gorgoniicola]